MNYDIEWLFEKVYSKKENNPHYQLKFLSDWDCYSSTDNEFSELLNDAFLQAKEDTVRYQYSFEQFDIKEKICTHLKEINSLEYNPDFLTITPSATVSIYLTIEALKMLSIRRCLLISPAYFSFPKNLSPDYFDVIYYHLSFDNSFKLDLNEIKKLVKTQYIDCIILTDPVYSTGIEFSESCYEEIIEIANSLEIYLVIDYSLGGLLWNESSTRLMPSEKIRALKKCKKFCFIDSVSKRLFINGIKSSIIFGTYDIIDKIDKVSEGIYGAMNTVQIKLLSKVFEPNSNDVLVNRMKQFIDCAQKNLALIKTILPKEYSVVSVNSGFFTYLFNINNRIEQINTRRVAEFLLDTFGIIILTNDRLGFFSSNNFGIRVNLSQDFQLLVESVKQCCRLPLDGFYNT